MQNSAAICVAIPWPYSDTEPPMPGIEDVLGVSVGVRICSITYVELYLFSSQSPIGKRTSRERQTLSRLVNALPNIVAAMSWIDPVAL